MRVKEQKLRMGHQKKQIQSLEFLPSNIQIKFILELLVCQNRKIFNMDKILILIQDLSICNNHLAKDSCLFLVMCR